jgi:hypothetical protein
VDLEQIVSRFDLVENINSDNGCLFTSKVLQGIMESLDIDCDCLLPGIPLSSGKVERMNQPLRNKLPN